MISDGSATHAPFYIYVIDFIIVFPVLWLVWTAMFGDAVARRRSGKVQNEITPPPLRTSMRDERAGFVTEKMERFERKSRS